MAKILLNKENLFHNFEVISKQTGSVEKVAVVLKDNAYGHGLLEIATYGYLDNAGIFKFPKLKPVMSLWANRLATREIKKGQSVGYGGTFTADKNMTVSTYDLGYGDGFLRLNERNSYTTPKGYKVLGRVSMDNLSLNTKDEEVCIFDDVEVLAKEHDTITYEITTTLSPFIKKEIV